MAPLNLPPWSLHEIGQRRLNERIAIVAGLRENVLVLDDLDVGNLDSLRRPHQADGLEGTVPDINSPCGVQGRHVASLSAVK